MLYPSPKQDPNPILSLTQNICYNLPPNPTHTLVRASTTPRQPLSTTGHQGLNSQHLWPRREKKTIIQTPNLPSLRLSAAVKGTVPYPLPQGTYAPPALCNPGAWAPHHQERWSKRGCGSPIPGTSVPGTSLPGISPLRGRSELAGGSWPLLELPNCPHPLTHPVETSKGVGVTGAAVARNNGLEDGDGDAEVEVGVGGPRTGVPRVAGHDAWWGRSNAHVTGPGQGTPMGPPHLPMGRPPAYP